MRVAHLTTEDLSLVTLLGAQLEASVAGGDEVLALSAPGPHVERLASWGVRHVALPFEAGPVDPRRTATAALQLARVLRAERPDVLHTHAPWAAGMGRIVGRAIGIPVVVNSCHGSFCHPHEGRLVRTAAFATEAIASRCSDAELFLNADDLEVAERMRVVRSDHAVFLGNGIDLRRFSMPADEDRELARRRLGLGPGHVAVGYVGRLVDAKGVPELVEAVYELGVPFRLVLVGHHDPTDVDSVDPALLDRVRVDGGLVLGHRDRLEELYPAFDMLVLPSHREGAPRPLMEAAACGVPVIATDVPGCRDVVERDQTGLLVPASDPVALADAIGQLGRSPELRSGLAAAARLKAERQFDERRIVQTVLHTYRRAAAIRDIGRTDTTGLVTRATLRLRDVVAALVLLALTAPLLAVTAAFLVARRRRPRWSVRRCAGRFGRPFDLRTLRLGAVREREPDGERPGRRRRLLRALERSPRLWNLLVGDLSLVGPAPIDHADAARLGLADARRLSVRPGLVPCVVRPRTVSPVARVPGELDYLAGRGWGTDLRIVARHLTGRAAPAPTPDPPATVILTGDRTERRRVTSAEH
ncbi:MAG: glycosyltransferase [Actinomycetota bacterium]|nr:glycosyltransferase [Actinomycetota bacterium]